MSTTPRGVDTKPKTDANGSNIKHELVFRSIKILDIGWAMMVYFLLAILSVKTLQEVTGPYNQEASEKDQTWKVLGRVCLRMWVYGVLAYASRNLFQLVPWPLEDVEGYKHLRVKEVLNSAVFISCVLSYDGYLQSEVMLLKKRLGMSQPVHRAQCLYYALWPETTTVVGWRCQNNSFSIYAVVHVRAAERTCLIYFLPFHQYAYNPTNNNTTPMTMPHFAP